MLSSGVEHIYQIAQFSSAEQGVRLDSELHVRCPSPPQPFIYVVYKIICCVRTFSGFKSTGFAFRFEHRKWNRGRNGLHQLGQPVAPSVLFPVFKSEGEPGTEYAIRSVPRFLFAVFMAGWWAETTTAVQPDEKKVTTGT